MTLIIIPDIFGKTPALERLQQKLTDIRNTNIIDPYGDGLFFRDEKTAYTHFRNCLTIPAYADLVRKKIEETSGPVYLLGFSAGASALWYLSGLIKTDRIKKAVGLYGSQIRNFANIYPGFATHLIFPISEPHFDVEDLQGQLAARPNLSCERSSGLHGFMNEYSANFNPDLYSVYIEEVLPEILRSKS
ncbi:MAG: hypothetical protein MI802_10860 [Desulfobacterales bacterium]|nr:hypothetical protein [Desulfobacterales bacterium]